MANHFLDNEEDTDARWEPLSDEEWDALTADLEPGSDTEAAVRQLRRRPHFLWYVPWSRKNSPAKTAAE